MLTVDALLGEPELGLRGVTVPDGEVSVRWVAVSELADPAPFLEGGEALLTTGLNTAGWADEWTGYVHRLVRARVAALGFAVGLTHERVPPELVRACEESGINLVEVPPATTFVAISRTVGRRLEEHGATAARRAFTMQRELTESALRRSDPGAVPRRLADVLDGAVATMTPDGRWETAPQGSHAQQLVQDGVADEVRRLRPQGLRASTVMTGADGTTVVQPVGLRGTPSLYLAAWVPGRLDDPHRSAITTAVALIGLALESRDAQRDTDRRLRGRAVELLSEGDPRTASIVLAAAAGTEVADVRLPARLQALLAGGGADAVVRALATLEELTGGRPLPLAAIAPGGRDPVAGEPGGRDPVAGEPGGRETALLVVTAPHDADRLVAELVGSGLRVGVGSAVRRNELGRSRAAAEHALGHTTDAAPVARWEELAGEGVLALVDQPTGDSFADTFLAPLDRYGDRRAELVQTLRAFLHHHGRIGPLAEELGVHRNTVRNRLREVEGALGRSLAEPVTRVNAWVALELEATRRLRTGGGGQAG